VLYSVIVALLLLLPEFASTATTDVTVDGAKKEGKLILYSAMNQADTTKLIALYRSRYPFVDASFFHAGSTPLINRILTETRANRFLFDVVSSKVSDLLFLQKNGLLGKIVSSELASFPEKFKDKQNRWVDIYTNYYTIAYNTNSIKAVDVPSKWEDLLDSKWKDGKIALDARAYDWFFGMVAAWGRERANDFIRKFNENRPTLRNGNPLIVSLLAAGEFPVAITYAHSVDRLRSKGAPVDWVPLRPMIALPIAIGLSARPLHPSAANLFIDLVLSKDGSELIKSIERVPTRSDVQPSAKRLDPRTLDLIPLHVSSDEMDPKGFRTSLGVK
jgi:iron(III) transport system substrate-binding protein